MKKITSFQRKPQQFLNVQDLDFDGEELQHVLESMPAPIVVFDKYLRFMGASERFFLHSPLKKNAIKPLDYWYTLVPDMPKKWKMIHQRCLKGERFKCDEDVFYRHDGSVEWWKWEIVPWYQKNKIIGGIILYAENITKQKNTEKNLRQMLHRLSESNSDLSKFAHVCAHDLYAPLRTISNYLYLMNKDFPQETEKLKTYYNTIMQNAEYMKNMISRTLKYSDMSEEKVDKSWFNLRHVLKNVVTSLASEIQTKQAKIEWDDLPTIFGDKTLISHVIQNLILNGLKYNDSETPVIKITAENLSDVWKIIFEDNGMGIEGRDLDKIFEAYQRLNQNKCEGKGLGLYRCKKIINDHEGSIGILSSSDKGTKFYFTLPKPRHIQ